MPDACFCSAPWPTRSGTPWLTSPEATNQQRWMTATAGSERADSRDSERAEIVPLVIEFVDVLCQPRSAIADVGLPSSALRSALRAARWVTAAPAIRWVAAVSGRGPDEVGIVTVAWRCSARWRAGSYGTRSCQQRHTIRHQPRPRVRIARGWSCPRALAAAYRSCAHGLWWRLVSASVTNAWRRRLLQAQRKRLPCVCRTRPRRRPGRRRRRGCRGWGSARGAPNVDDFSRPAPSVCCPEPTRLLLFSRRLRARRSQWRPNAARRGASACSLSAVCPELEVECVDRDPT